MSHMIDETNGRPAIAYVGETPWHGLGANLSAGADLETWTREAGLDFRVDVSPCEFVYRNDEGVDVRANYASKRVLFRSDTKAPLSVMSDGFNPHQPADVLGLYRNIARAGGFELETAGALDEGRRIWALARVGDGADIVNRDRVRPYLLLATSFDGSMATQVRFTAIRVVCHNTISAVVGSSAERGKSVGGEKVDRRAGRQQIARVLHSTKWTDDLADQIRMELGIVHNDFERFVVESRALANITMSDDEVDAFVALLLEPYTRRKDAEGRPIDPRDTRAYKRICELVAGKAIGAEFAPGTRWQALNAVTQFIDHERGIAGSTRLESAWFGTGNAIKERAFSILSAQPAERVRVAA